MADDRKENESVVIQAHPPSSDLSQIGCPLISLMSEMEKPKLDSNAISQDIITIIKGAIVAVESCI